MQSLPVMRQWVAGPKSIIIKEDLSPGLQIFCHELDLASLAMKHMDTPILEAKLITEYILAKEDQSTRHVCIFRPPQPLCIPGDQIHHSVPDAARKHMETGFEGIESVLRCIKFSKTWGAFQ